MDPSSLETRLDQVVRRIIDGTPADVAIRLAGIDVGRFRELAPARATLSPYSRKLILSTPEYEVALASWNEGIACAPHDHGVSEGWIYCLTGRLRETEYRWTGDSLVEVGRYVRDAGTASAVRADEIHTCVGEGETLTLHIYFPRSESVRIFDTAGRRTLTVVGEVGAWFPVAPEQIRETLPWPSPV